MSGPLVMRPSSSWATSRASPLRTCTNARLSTGQAKWASGAANRYGKGPCGMRSHPMPHAYEEPPHACSGSVSCSPVFSSAPSTRHRSPGTRGHQEGAHHPHSILQHITQGLRSTAAHKGYVPLQHIRVSFHCSTQGLRSTAAHKGYVPLQHTRVTFHCSTRAPTLLLLGPGMVQHRWM